MSMIVAQPHATVSPAVGIALTAVLVLLLIVRELMRAHGGKRSGTTAAFLAVPIAPLFLVVGAIVLQRLGGIYAQSQANQATQSSASPPSTPSARPRGTATGDGGADAFVSIGAPRLHDILVNPNTLRFGRQQARAASAAANIRVVNIATTLLPIGVVIIGVDRRDFVERDTCGGVAGLGAYAGCTITVTFTPRHGGTHHAALVISSAASASTRPPLPSGTPPPLPQTGSELRVQVLSSRLRPGGSARIALSYAPQALVNINVSYPGQGTISFFDTTDDYGRLTLAVPVPQATALHYGQATLRITVRAVDGARHTQVTRTLMVARGRDGQTTVSTKVATGAQ